MWYITGMAKIWNFLWKNFKKYLWVLLIVGVALGVRWYYTRDGIKSLSVKKVSIENRVVVKTVSASGEIKSPQDADLSFNYAGRISYIGIKKGDVVKKGQLLAQLDNYALQQTIQSYKDARDVALLDKAIYMEKYSDRPKSAGSGGQDVYNITLKQYDEAASEAEASYQAQSAALKNTYIYAPFDGIVVDVTKEVGETIAATSTVIKVANLDNMIFEIELDQEDYGFIKEGQKAEIKLDSYPNERFQAEVSKLPLYADGADNASFIVELSVKPNDPHIPLLGMTGDAYITVQTSENEVSSLMYDEVFTDENGNNFIWVLSGQLIERQDIEIGIEGDMYTEIKTKVDKPVLVGVNDSVEIKSGYKAAIVK